MATTIEQQVTLDEALVPSVQRLRIGQSNFRLPSDIQSKKSTLQVVYDVLRRSPFFKAFLVTADVPKIYMQEFWATAKVHQHSIRFKMDTRKHIVDLEAFREMLHISPRVLGQSFDEFPFEEDILEFLRFLGHMINKCLTGKSSGIDSLRLSQAQNLWGLYHRRNVDYAFLIWEDLVYQVEHKNLKKSNEMYYPRFTKVIIHHFMTKKPSIPRRNKVNWHYVRDDILFLTIKVVSRHQDTQQYGAILPIELTTKDIRNTKAYKEYYACATGEVAPKPKGSARRKKGGSASSTTPPTPIATPTPITTVVAAPRLSAAAKGKQPARATSPTDPSDVERTKAEQLKIVLRKSRQETHIFQHGGFSIDKGTGSKPGVPNVPSDDSEEEISWNSFDDEDVDDQTKGRDDNEGKKTDESDDDDDQDEAEKVNDDDDNEEEISKIDEQEATVSGEGDDEETESDRESEEEETKEKVEESFDLIPRTPEDDEDDGNGEKDQGLRISEEERMHEEEEADELYRDVDINQGRGLQVSQDIEDSHVTLTLTHSDGMESIFMIGLSFVTPIPSPKSTMTPSIITTTTIASQPPIPPTPIPSDIFPTLPTFTLVFRFKDRVKSLEVNFSNIPGIVHQYMHQQMPEAIREVVQIQTDQLQDFIQRENDEFLITIDDNMKKIIKEQVKSQVKAQVTRILPRIEESVNAQLEAEVLTRSSYSSRTSYAMAADLSEMELNKILIEKMEANKSIQEDVRMMMVIRKNPLLDQTEGLRDDEKAGSMHQPALHLNQLPRVPAGPQQGLNLDRCLPVSLLLQRNLCSLPVRWRNPHIWCLKQNKTFPAVQGNAQLWISVLAKQTNARSSFNELLDTLIDFSNFIMNRLGVDTLTPELLAGPTYELMRGSCNSLTELECHLKEVYKATTDQLDWVNPEGQQYPHNLL
nr:hypothetical protein [Tanacetum cinerariifolium]